jgi:hypothetical protein
MRTCYYRNFLHYMEPESSLPHSQQPAAYPCPKPDKSSHALSFIILLRPIEVCFLFHLCLGRPIRCFLQKSLTHLPSMRATCPIHPVFLMFWWIAQMTKLSILYSFPLFCYLLNFRPRHLTQHPILESPQPLFFPKYERPSFTPI